MAAAGNDYRDTKFTFDSQGRQLSRTLPLGASPVAALPAGTDVRTLAGVAGAFTEGFWYNDRGQKTRHVSFEGVVTSSAYDMGLGGGRLTEERFFDSLAQYNHGTGTPSEIWAHTYDALGREVQVVQDGDGNLATTSDQRVTATAYDAAGRIVSVTAPGGIVSYEYDVLGRLVRTFAGSAAAPLQDTRYAFDSLGRLDQVSTHAQAGVAVVPPQLTTYDYDLLGNLDALRSPGSVVADYLYDGHGSTRALADSTGQVVVGQEYSYSAYGGAIGCLPHAATTSLQSSAEWTVAESELQYLRDRWYSYTIGAFSTTDPFAGNTHSPLSLHKYLYVHADPITGTDPAGRFTVIGAISGIGNLTALNSVQAESSTPLIDSFHEQRMAWEGFAMTSLLPVLGAVIGDLAEVIGPWVDSQVTNRCSLQYIPVILKRIEGAIPGTLVQQLAAPKALHHVILKLRLINEEVIKAGSLAGGWAALRAIGHGRNPVGHHLIPLDDLREFPGLFRRAVEGGFDVSGVRNGMLLSTIEHAGPHKPYSAIVLNELKDLLQSSPVDLTSAEVLAEELWAIAARLRSDITSRKLLPNN